MPQNFNHSLNFLQMFVINLNTFVKINIYDKTIKEFT